MRFNNEGSLLVMSTVLLGVIAFTAIFMSLTLIYEVKSTRFSDNAAIAYYTAESGAEDALFRLRRSKEFSDPDFFDDKQGDTLCAAEHGDVSGTTAPAENACLASSLPVNADAERIFDYVELATHAEDIVITDIEQNTTAFADIYDPALEGPPSGDEDTGVDQVNVNWYLDSCTGADGSAKLEVTFTPILISTLAPQPQSTIVDVCGCGGTPVDGLYKCDYASTFAVSYPVDSDKFYRISFRPIDRDVNKIVMTTQAAGGAVPVPSQIAVAVTGKYREAQAILHLRGSWRDALSGIFNYVLFSEESLIKDTPGQGVTPFDSLCGLCSNSVSGGPYYYCSGNADCTSGGTCTIVNSASDSTDGSESAAFCSEETAAEDYLDGSPLVQTDAGTCNAKCNGLTFCGDGTEQTTGSGTITGYSTCSGGPTPNALCEVTADCGSGGTCVQTAKEECDYGAGNNNSIPDTCRENCRKPYCGDSVVDTLSTWALGRAEECDDDNAATNDACDTLGTTATERGVANSRCMLTICGDGVVQNTGTGNGQGIVEQCDNGTAGSLPNNAACGAPGTCSTACTICP